MSTPLPTEMTVRNFLTKELEKRAVKVQTEWSYTTPIGRLAPDMRLMNGAEYVVETKLGAESKPELQEVFETYTDTWDKMVKVEILKQYTANGKIIFTMNPDFQEIPFVEPPTEEEGAEERYTESYHLEDVEKNIASVYEKIKTAMLKLDSNIRTNPQKYYVSLRKNKNFACISFRKKKIWITIMLPYETGINLIKKHKLKQLSAGVQKFYNGPCFTVTVEKEDNLDEIIKTLEEAYKLQS